MSAIFVIILRHNGFQRSQPADKLIFMLVERTPMSVAAQRVVLSTSSPSVSSRCRASSSSASSSRRAALTPADSE